MRWTRERTALIVCGAGVGAFLNLWVTVANPWVGLFLPCFAGILGVYLLSGVEIDRNEGDEE